ncbi:hypothetical protein J2T60_000550 [Natronospira proteinivora]|uniref:FAD/NAD(P)-binding domain-containing protein n=1 Tax=Natronospira proteinivora TaxID=1807133 RepID=A0ABT1G5L7_9GAMM|nr:FAD-dependent oxidoreductase [Natronospira proteinivora]MCP1726585.1 hypothetical protein [Natronospira proteinivora]
MTERCDVCIVGAGISGLNALFVARQYLSRDQRVVLVDRRTRVGGMWLDTYDYIRLHQPHPFFTAGNIEWTLSKKREHLAAKDEVLDHLSHCLAVIKRHIRVTELFGYEFEKAEELDGKVRISCKAGEGYPIEIEADRLIKAYGQGVETNAPLKLSSACARSVSPDYFDVGGPEMRVSNAPVWIVGGGKTGMDTAHVLITEQPGREVNLVAGPGTLFMSRDRLFPRGARRWREGDLMSSIFIEMARRFDGFNEADVLGWFYDNYGISLTPKTGNFLLAILSEAEKETIAAGLNEVVMDYLTDVVDCDGGTEVVLRSGETRSFEPGSWVVNCTGSLIRGEHPYEPYASASGRVLSIQNRSVTIPFPPAGAAAYFLTHLLFLDKLAEVPLYAMDLEALRRKAPQYVMGAGLGPLQLHNLSLIAEAVPARQFAKIFYQSGFDLDRWFPIPRRLRASAGFMLTHKRDRKHHRRTLDTLAERFGIRCEPVVGTGQA